MSTFDLAIAALHQEESTLLQYPVGRGVFTDMQRALREAGIGFIQRDASMMDISDWQLLATNTEHRIVLLDSAEFCVTRKFELENVLREHVVLAMAHDALPQVAAFFAKQLVFEETDEESKARFIRALG